MSNSPCVNPIIWDSIQWPAMHDDERDAGELRHERQRLLLELRRRLQEADEQTDRRATTPSIGAASLVASKIDCTAMSMTELSVTSFSFGDGS